MSYVVVEDVAASWEEYERFAEAFAGQAPAGLIVHTAGPTDEGVRVVALWESEDAWLDFSKSSTWLEGSLARSSAVRAMHPRHVVYGEREVEAWQAGS